MVSLHFSQASQSTTQKIFVAVAGNIGTGKTTLTQMLSQRFGWSPHYEAVSDNPYLEDFYKDMARWSFPLQIYFLNHRFKAHQGIGFGDRSAIQDRSIYEDANIFARNLYETGKMEERDYRNYLELYRVMTTFLQPPDLVVYLKKSLPCLRQRIDQRGRAYEADIPDDYLESLNHYYSEWMQSYSRGKKVILETDTIDFVRNPRDFDWVCDQILGALDQPDLFLEQTGLVTEEKKIKPGIRTEVLRAPQVGGEFALV